MPANEFLTIEGRKLSTSQNWAVWLPDYLSRYDPDPQRYMLSVKMPETGDSDFSWREFVQRNNDELVAAYGNLVNRVLVFTYRNFDGCVPIPGQLDDRDKDIVREAEKSLDEISGRISKCEFKQALMHAMQLARETNQYLDNKS